MNSKELIDRVERELLAAIDSPHCTEAAVKYAALARESVKDDQWMVNRIQYALDMALHNPSIFKKYMSFKERIDESPVGT